MPAKADIVCRVGGDEFAVLLDDLSESAEEAAAQAQDVGERIRASIGQPCLLDGRECITTASIGMHGLRGWPAEHGRVDARG